MATYRIVDMYRKSKAVKGIHYDSWNEPIFAYRVDKRHSLLFGLIHYWDYGAYNLCPEYLFTSADKAEEISKALSGRFNKEGYDGWELVQWNLMPPTALLTATTTPCCGSTCILATFKKKLRV